jgi:hypothetical protein
MKNQRKRQKPAIFKHGEFWIVYNGKRSYWCTSWEKAVSVAAEVSSVGKASGCWFKGEV